MKMILGLRPDITAEVSAAELLLLPKYTRSAAPWTAPCSEATQVSIANTRQPDIRLLGWFSHEGGKSLMKRGPLSATEHDAQHEAYLHQVQRILASNTFKISATLQQLLQFLAERSLHDCATDLKEYTIGVEALGRKQDFDPKADSIVRVQMYRLRQKLGEYYDCEGREDAVWIELPNRHYALHFEILPTPPECKSDFKATMVPAGSEVLPADRKFEVKSLPVVPRCQIRRSYLTWASANPVADFWDALLASDPNPIIDYADAIFLLDSSNDLFSYRSGAAGDRGARVDPHLARRNALNPFLVAQAGPLYYENGYTGTGELEAAVRLAELFTRLGKVPTILSSRDITGDDFRRHTVILLGSPGQNPAVAQLPPNGDFSFEFEDADSNNGAWAGYIVYRQSSSGQTTEYRTERDPETGVLKSDFGLFSVQPGILPGHFLIVMAGLDTKGTEGSARYATSISGVEELSKALAAAGLDRAKRFSPGFQALLRVHLEKGYQVLDTSLVKVQPFLESVWTNERKSPEQARHKARD